MDSVFLAIMVVVAALAVVMAYALLREKVMFVLDNLKVILISTFALGVTVWAILEWQPWH